MSVFKKKLTEDERASCEKACLINQKRRESAVRKMKALRTKCARQTEQSRRAIEALAHASWALRHDVISIGSNEALAYALDNIAADLL